MVDSIALIPGGPVVSRLSAGFWRLASWNMRGADLASFVEECLDLGITCFDHAALYGDYTCEELFGEALTHNPALRNRMQIVTKCGIRKVSSRFPEIGLTHYDTSKSHILESVEDSLRALRTDYIDVLLIHRPDLRMDADEVADAFTTLHRDGKVRFFGVSNFTPSQFGLLDSRLPFRLVTNQVEISVLHLDPFLDGTLDQCQQRRMAPLAWSPLGGGRLFGDEPRAERVRRALTRVGEALGGATANQVAFAWLLNHPARIVPVLGTGKIERVRETVEATALHLSREQWYTVWTASTGEPVP